MTHYFRLSFENRLYKSTVSYFYKSVNIKWRFFQLIINFVVKNEL